MGGIRVRGVGRAARAMPLLALLALGGALVTVPAASQAQPARRPVARPRRVQVQAPRVCVPGAQVRCDCPGGDLGAQQCNQAGSGFEACQCIARTERPVAPARLAYVAAEPPPRRTAAAEQATHWYGWQILIVDLAAITLASASLGVGSTTGYYTAGGLQLLGGPIVHWSHGRVGAGFGSLGLRVLVPAGAAALGSMKGTTGLLVGASLGSLVAMVVDIAALANEPVEAGPAARGGWSPVIAIAPREFALGVAGTF